MICNYFLILFDVGYFKGDGIFFCVIWLIGVFFCNCIILLVYVLKLIYGDGNIYFF